MLLLVWREGHILNEASTDCAYVRSCYAILYARVAAKGGEVVLNPRTQTSECFMSVADTVCRHRRLFRGLIQKYTHSYSAPAG